MTDKPPGEPGQSDRALMLALKVWEYKQGEAVSLMIHLGDRLGLYRAMAGLGAMTPTDLARLTGLDGRWLTEWLLGQAAAGLVDSVDGLNFELSEDAASVLADEDNSLLFAAGAFGAPLAPPVVDAIVDGFSTGVGFNYDRQGAAGAHQTERSLGPWARLALVPVVLPALDGVVAKLERGVRVADVGCGGGVALGVMARAFPASRFVGFDPSVFAVDRARERISAEGLNNAEVRAERAEDLIPDGSFDLVITFDCLHDMTQPAQALAAIHGAMAPDSTLLIKDIRSTGDFASNRSNPMLALMYAMSVSCCMASALSEPGGAGLGTLGLFPDRARSMCTQAGFTRFAVHDFGDPANLYYEVRP